MNIRFEQRNAFEVFGIEKIFKETKKNKIPEFWKECHKNGSYEKLFIDAGGKQTQDQGGRCLINAVCGYRDTGKNTFPYMLCAERTQNSKLTGYTIIEIPASTWVVFRSTEADSPGEGISGLFRNFYKEWLPTSGYNVLNAPDMEVYYSGKNGKFFEELWVAVKDF